MAGLMLLNAGNEMLNKIVLDFLDFRVWKKIKKHNHLVSG